MITIISLNENDELVKNSVKGLVILETENIVCVDAETAESLAKHLEEENPQLSDKIRKLLSAEG